MRANYRLQRLFVPADLTTGKGRRLARWTWMPVPGDPDTITVVLFDVGRIVEIERTVVKR